MLNTRKLSVLAAALWFSFALSGCGGGGGGGTGPAMDPVTMPPEEPSSLTSADIESILDNLLESPNSPALTRHANRPPPPDAVTCQAETIGCQGGFGVIYHQSSHAFDFAGFVFREHRQGVDLAEKLNFATGHRALGGWMDHSVFLMETPGDGKPFYNFYSMGNESGTNPGIAPGGSATWSGVMAGVGLEGATADFFVSGYATITVYQRGTSLVDVAFTNIRNETSGGSIDDMSWLGLALEDGSFGTTPLDESYFDSIAYGGELSGRFYGPGHQEVGGLFDHRTFVNVGGSSRPISIGGVFGGGRN